MSSSIPTITSPAVVPQPEMNPSIAGQPGQALARLGGQMEAAADYGVQVADRIRDAQDHLALLSAGNQITKAFDGFQEALAQSGDPDNLPNAQGWTDDLKSAFSQNPKYADPRIQRAVELHIDAVGNDAQHLMTMRQLTLQQQQELANLGELQQSIAFQMAEAPDATTRSLARGKYEVAVSDAERHGWVSTQQADVQLRNLDRSAEDTEIVNALASYNPDRIQAMIDKTADHPELFAALPPQRLAELRKQLDAVLPVAKARMDKNDIEMQGTPVISKYENDAAFLDAQSGKIDLNAAAAAASTDPTLSVKMQDYVSEELKKRASLQDTFQRKADKKALDDYSVKAETGELSPQELMRIEHDATISPDVRAGIIKTDNQIKRENRIQDTQERALARQERQDTSTDLREQLLSQPGLITSQSELTQYRIKGLSAADANTVWKAKGPASDPAFMDALKRINSSPAYSANTDETNQAKEAFMSQFVHTVESKQLTGDQITKQLDSDIAGANKSVIGGWLDKVEKWWKAPPSNGNIVEPKKMPTAPDYDTEGAKAAGLKPDARGHMPDTFKLPNHMTFSDESKYSKPGQEGGHWKYVDKSGKETDDKAPGGTWAFYASPFNLTQHTPAELQEYFRTQEPGSKLFLPVESRRTKDGRILTKYSDGTIR